MAKPKSEKLGLPLDEDRAFQNRFWLAQRIAWVALGVIVVVALLGFTGRGGPFARTTAQAQQSSIDYPRVTRWEAPDQVIIRFGGGGDRGVIEVDRAFGQVFSLTDVQPQPTSSVATAWGQRLEFELEPSAEQRTVTLHVRALRPALPLTTRVRIDDGPPLTLTPVVLP